MHTTTPKSLGMDLPAIIVLDAEQGGKTFTMHPECWDRVRAYWANMGDPYRMSEYGPTGPIEPDQCAYKDCKHAAPATTELETTELKTTELATTELATTTTEEPAMSTTAPHVLTIADARKLATVLAYVKRSAGVTAGAARLNPPMGTITIAATARTLTITHTGYETTTETHLEATTDSAEREAEWSADVPLDALADAAKAAKAGPLTITPATDGRTLTVDTGGQEHTIPTAAPDDKATATPAPDLTATDADHEDQEDERTRAAAIARNEDPEPAVQEARERREVAATTDPRTTTDAPVILDGPTLAATVAHGAAAAGSDDTLPMLTGAHIQIEQGGTLAIAATDRFRLAVAEADPAARAGETAALAPAKWLMATAKLMAKDSAVALSIARRRGEDGILGASDYWITMAGDTTTSSARLIDAEFPKFRRLLRADAETDARFTTDAAALVKLVKPWSRDSYLDLIIDPNGTVTAERRTMARADDMGPATARATLDAGEVYAGAPTRIRLDAKYLASLIAAAPRGSKATFRIDSPSRPIMISHPGGVALQMPIRIAA